MARQRKQRKRLRHIGDFSGPAAAPKKPTNAVPGSEAKLRIMEQRAAAGQCVFSGRDRPDCTLTLGLERDGAEGRARNGSRSMQLNDRGERLGAPVEANQDAETELRLTVGNLTLFSEKLSALRRRRGLSLAELAARAGLDKSSLSKLENGLRQPYLETAVLLAKALGVPIALLAGQA